MNFIKGFSIIEFLVVVALIGVLSVFFYTPRTTKWNTELSSAQSKTVSFLKYYQKKSMRDGYKYYLRMNLDAANSTFSIDPFIDDTITSRQSTCVASADTDFQERRTFEPINDIRVIGCATGGNSCANSSASNMGICFFPNGSSRSTNNRLEWYLSHAAGDDATHATVAYRLIVWNTTSFIQTFKCRGDATFTTIGSTGLPCTLTPTNEWIEE